MSTSTTREPLPPGAGPNGWLAFASILLFLNGLFGAFWGLAAILNDQAITTGRQGVVLWDFTTWGWITLIVSLLLVATAVGLVLGKSAARWFAVVVVTIHALGQFPIIPVNPIWSILVITIDIVILYNLFVRWQLED